MRFSRASNSLIAASLICITFCSVNCFSDGNNSVAHTCKSVLTALSAAKSSNTLSSLNYLPDDVRAEIVNDPDMVALFSNANFVEYLEGVLEGKSINDLRTELYNMWLDPEVNSKNLVTALNKIKPLLATLDRQAPTESVTKVSFGRVLRYKISRFHKQLLALPATLKRIKSLIETDMSPNELDARVFDFKGYLDLKLFNSRIRPWARRGEMFKNVRLKQLKGIDPISFINLSMIASEIENPIAAYSDNSGEVMRIISPQASRFMGKTAEEATYHQREIENKRAHSYCTNSWCFEEARHEGVLANVAKAIVGFDLPTFQPFTAYPNLDPANTNDAFFHLVARNDTEWHAASAYFILAAHADGAAAEWLANIRQDELKHMAIFGGLYKYIFGDTYNKRMAGMLKKAWAEAKEKGETTYGNFIDPFMVAEFTYTHLKYEKEIRRFFRSLPLKTLRKIFETPVNLAPLPADPIDPALKAQYDSLTERETVMRKSLARWSPGERAMYNKLDTFEIRNDALITKVTDLMFGFFKGCEDYGNADSLKAIARIDALTVLEIQNSTGETFSQKDLKWLKRSLKETLRDYQIVNNRSVRSMGLHVHYVNAHYGFDVTRDEAYDATKKTEI